MKCSSAWVAFFGSFNWIFAAGTAGIVWQDGEAGLVSPKSGRSGRDIHGSSRVGHTPWAVSWILYGTFATTHSFVYLVPSKARYKVQRKIIFTQWIRNAPGRKIDVSCRFKQKNLRVKAMLNWKNQDAIAWLCKEFPDNSLQVWMSPLSPLHFIPGNQNKNYLPGGRSAPNHGTLCALEISRASKEAKESKGWRRVEIIFPAFSLLSFLLGDVFLVSTGKLLARGEKSMSTSCKDTFFLLRGTGSCLGKNHPCDAVLGSNIFPPFTRTPGCVGNSWGPLDDHFLWDSKMSALHSENKLGYYNECK